MLRSLYASVYGGLVRLHPRAFQKRFGEEMLSIFDNTPSADRFALVGDAAFSLLRQRLLRSEIDMPEHSAKEAATDVPLFLVLDDDPRLSKDRWMGGATLSLFSFMAASFLISHGGHPFARTIGSRVTSEAGVRVGSDTQAADPDTEVAVRPELNRELVSEYFHAMPVLDSLDANHDLILSAGEIANAPKVLRSLDLNHDGVLDAKECGAIPAALDFMSSHPVLAALDTDHDGVISASEIRNAAAALLQLDANHDGELSAEELLPENMLNRAKGRP
jgi:hypothetical protein